MNPKYTIACIVLSTFQIMAIAASSNANPYGDSVKNLERDADILINYGKRENKKIISGLSCQELINSAELKRRNYYRWHQIAQNSPT